ncbi:unnamed protein product [Rhizoctonia solani]|uniref:Meiotic nuclear division protein 1 n=1 Tax=Rhizoctonia solani TaxID=456999 RepID=A0A8H3B5Q7_9AGAM|nr:unnamed protein product [Rhizoctonia solani]
MAPRGLSAEEKRVKLVELFHETQDFYQLKELEKLAPKMKGIVSQSVKEVLQSLVDDNLVQMDKIGSSNCELLRSIGHRIVMFRRAVFWSFPSARGATLTSNLASAKEELAALESKISSLTSEIEDEGAQREETEDRRTSLAQLAQNRAILSELESEMAQYGLADPVVLERKRRAVVLAREAACRWTDNYSVLFSHITKTLGCDAGELRGFLGVGEDYEDIE